MNTTTHATRSERDHRLAASLYVGLALLLVSVILFGFWAMPVLVIALLGLSAPLLAWYRRVDTGVIGPE